MLVFRGTNGQPVAVPSEVVTAGERAYRCHCLRMAGKSWEDIAAEEGYPNGRAAMADVKRYLEEGASMIIESSSRQMLALEVSRLDALQSAIWDSAMAGSIPAVKMAMDLIRTRSTLVGLDPEKMAQEGEIARTVVVMGEDGGYLAGLKLAAGAARNTLPDPPA